MRTSATNGIACPNSVRTKRRIDPDLCRLTQRAEQLPQHARWLQVVVVFGLEEEHRNTHSPHSFLKSLLEHGIVTPGHSGARTINRSGVAGVGLGTEECLDPTVGPAHNGDA